MSKILKIEDAKVVTERGKKITRYVFNNDKIVRVDTETDEVITKNVPQTYLNLISLYSTHVDINDDEDDDDDEEEEEERTSRRSSKRDLEQRINIIRSGEGAGLGVFLGLLLKFTIIGPFIAGFFSIGFLNDISDEEYLKTADPREINFRKGFFATAVFGWLIAIICCAQWKADMISVLEGDPTAPSLNRHSCFKVWFWITFVFDILYFIYYLNYYAVLYSY